MYHIIYGYLRLIFQTGIIFSYIINNPIRRGLYVFWLQAKLGLTLLMRKLEASETNCCRHIPNRVFSPIWATFRNKKYVFILNKKWRKKKQSFRSKKHGVGFLLVYKSCCNKDSLKTLSNFNDGNFDQRTRCSMFTILLLLAIKTQIMGLVSFLVSFSKCISYAVDSLCIMECNFLSICRPRSGS